MGGSHADNVRLTSMLVVYSLSTFLKRVSFGIADRRWSIGTEQLWTRCISVRGAASQASISGRRRFVNFTWLVFSGQPSFGSEKIVSQNIEG